MTAPLNVPAFAALGSLFLLGCSGGNANPVTSNDGGGMNIGGSRATNGGTTVANGGTTIELGGNSGIGGAPSNGGQQSNEGGSFGQGGLVGQGGAVTTLGGQPANGGSSGAGTVNGGGSTANGGAVTGGKANAGGTIAGGAATGGKANSSGTSSIGSATGGAAMGGKATGGNSSSGGAATGGKATGGATTGGAATAGSTGNGATPIKIWIAGDSTVQNCSSACPCGWGSQFDPLFNSNVTVVNSAVGGRSIQTWLYEGNVSDSMANGDCTLTSTAYNARWTAMTNTSTGMKAGDYLFIQFGINDGDSTCPRHVSTTLYQTYLGMMAQAAKSAGAQPVFLTPTNAITCSGSTVSENRGFLSETKATGSQYDVPVIDLNQLTINLYTQLGFCPNDGDYTSGTLGALFCEDHTHFEAAGAKQVAQVVAQALKDQGIGLAAYLL